MIIYKHRVNTVQELIETPHDLGVEIDIRSYGDKLILHHDAFVDAVSLREWLRYFDHKSIILNVKEEGLENRIIEEVEGAGVSDFFFLDQSFPFLIKGALAGETRSAARLSEYESIETIHKLSGLVKWVWVDCFTKFPIEEQMAFKLQRKHGFKLCLVSPELQGRTQPSHVSSYVQELKDHGIEGDAVCTKLPHLWV